MNWRPRSILCRNKLVAVRSIRRRLLRDRRGATSLEFAILGTALMTMCLGILEYGRLSWTREALQAIANQGARCMGLQAASCAVAGAYDSATTVTYLSGQAATWDIALTTSSFTLTRGTTCGGVGGFSQVAISYTFQTVLPLLLTQASGGVPLVVKSCFPNQS